MYDTVFRPHLVAYRRVSSAAGPELNLVLRLAEEGYYAVVRRPISAGQLFLAHLNARTKPQAAMNPYWSATNAAATHSASLLSSREGNKNRRNTTRESCLIQKKPEDPPDAGDNCCSHRIHKFVWRRQRGPVLPEVAHQQRLYPAHTKESELTSDTSSEMIVTRSKE